MGVDGKKTTAGILGFNQITMARLCNFNYWVEKSQDHRLSRWLVLPL